MATKTLSLAELSHRAIGILSRELGVVDALRFMSQFSNGFGDYTVDRERMFADKTLKEIVAEIKSRPPTPEK